MTLNETSDSRTISAEPLNIITQQAVGYDYCLVIGSHWLQNGFLFFVRLSDKNERGAAAFIQFVWTHFLFEWNFGYIQVPNNDVQTNTQRLNLKHFLERYSKWEVLLVSSGWIHIKELWNKMHDNVCYLISPPWYAERLYCFNCVGICQRDIILLVSQDFGNFVLVHLERFEVRCQEIPTSRFDWNTALFEASADRPGRESPSHFLSAIISVSHTLQLHVSKAPPCQTQAAKTEMETQVMLSWQLRRTTKTTSRETL